MKTESATYARQLNKRARSGRHPISTIAAVAGALLLALAPGAAAAGGPLDPNFGEDGIVLAPLGGNSAGEGALGLTEDGRGRLIAAGTTDSENILVRRFHPNGSPDRSFDGNGVVETSLSETEAQAVTTVRGGGILVAGGTETGLALVRYRGNGSRASSFGHDGHVVTPGGIEGASALAVDTGPGGRIVSGGYKIDLSGRWTAMVIGYRSDGSLDPGFGHGGMVEFRAPKGLTAAISGVEVLPSGEILAGGDFDGRLLLVKLLPSGRPDPRFGRGDGIVWIDVDGGPHCACSFANSLTLAPGGRPLLAGVTLGPGSEAALLARFMPDGRLDRSFGRRGVVHSRRGSRLVFNDATTQADGRITAAGFYNLRSSGEAQIAVLRYLPSGRIDAGFAQGGFFHRHFGRESIGSAAITQPDGRVVVAGRASFGSLDPEFPSAVEGGQVLMLRFKR
jgi:uncharacterized delta-60 repeat protein